MSTQRSALRSLASVALGFELIILGLAGLTLFGLDALAPLPRWWALVGAAVLIAVSIVALALLPRPIGIALGWSVQALLVASGLFAGVLFLAGGMFAALYGFCVIKGRQLDTQE